MLGERPGMARLLHAEGKGWLAKPAQCPSVRSGAEPGRHPVERRAHRRRRRGDEGRRNAPAVIRAHRAGATSMVPAPVRAKRSGRYMSSITAGGWA